jgi:hypothetical protein
MSDSKPWWKSKTLQLNGVAFLLACLNSLINCLVDGNGTRIAPAELVLPAGWEPYAVKILIVLNILVRFWTSKGVSLRAAVPADGSEPPRPRLWKPAAVVAVLIGLSAIAQAQPTPAGPPKLIVHATETKQIGDRFVIDCTETVADRVEFVVWAEGLPSGSAGLDRFKDVIEELRRLGAEITIEPQEDGERYLSRFAFDGRTSILCFDVPPGAHYVVAIFASNEFGSTSTMVERRIPGTTPPAPVPVPVPPGPAPNPAPNPPAPPGPTPPVPPTPPTPPQPNVPEGRFGVSKRVFDWASSVKSSTRKDEAQKIARVLQDVASRVKGGQVAGNTGIRTSLIDGMRQALDPQQLLNWIAFGEQLARLIVEYLPKLQTPQDWVDFLVEIANALVLVL